jgi:hypothetical protein
MKRIGEKITIRSQHKNAKIRYVVSYSVLNVINYII